VKLAVFGRFRHGADATVTAVADAADSAGHDVVRLDIADVVGGPMAFDPLRLTLRLGDAALHLADLDALFLGPLPSPWAKVSPPGEDAAAAMAALDARRVAQAGRAALAWSVVLTAESIGVPVLSSPTRARPYDHKPFQLAALARAGIRVPQTLVTDHADDDDAASPRVDVVRKPVVGGPVQRGSVHQRGTPQLVQTLHQGRQLRLAVVGGVVVAVGAIDLDADELARSVDVRRSQQRWRPVAVTEALQALGTRAAACCHFDVCAIDAIEDADGSIVVVDVNRTPQLIDLQADTGTDIIGAIVKMLAQRVERLI
jgi:glutathione synthase/RimK-type ligase-like ATP-grasp enzyme